MKVKVVTKYPIPGILPKNKCIQGEMELDLNKNEIIHCMQFGNVFDEDGNILDRLSLKNIDKPIKPRGMIKPIVFTVTPPEDVEIKVEPGYHEPISEPKLPKQGVVGAPISIKGKETTESVEVIKKDFVKDYTLKVVSCVKEDNFYVLEVEFCTGVGKIGGNMYGLFSNVDGSKRPYVLEYKNGDTWQKFNNKFSNFDVLANGDKFVFRFIPATDKGVFKYKLVIKEVNNELVTLKDEIDLEK